MSDEKSEIITDFPASAPLMLFLELEPGQSVRLDSAARIALAWHDLIIEIFSVIDPSAEVRVELIDAVEGSLGFRSLISAISKVAGQHPLLTTAISAIIGSFLHKPVDDLSELFWNEVYKVVGEAYHYIISQEEKEKIAEAVKIAQRQNVAYSEKKRLFSELGRDEAIISAGMTPDHQWKGGMTVPRSEFLERSGQAFITEAVVRKRTVTETIPVILRTAKLESKQLAWRFTDNNGYDFSAKMKDMAFLERLHGLHTGIELRIGMDMTLEVETKQELVDGVWLETERSVIRVVEPQLPPSSSGQSNFLDH